METMSTSRKKAGKSSKLFGQPEPEAANMQKMIWRFLAIIAVLVWTVAAGHPAAEISMRARPCTSLSARQQEAASTFTLASSPGISGSIFLGTRVSLCKTCPEPDN